MEPRSADLLRVSGSRGVSRIGLEMDSSLTVTNLAGMHLSRSILSTI